MLPLVRGFDDVFMAPHSRHTEVRREDIEKISELQIVAYSPQAGVHVVMDRNGRKIFVTGHFEYDPHTLHHEYVRDKNKGLDIDIPQNYFLNDDPSQRPVVTWRSHANLFFANWLNYYVYQSTPYNIDSIQ